VPANSATAFAGEDKMIDAFLLLKDGTLKRTQDVEEAVRFVETAGDGWRLWLDLENPPEEEFGILKALFDFHPLALEDCLRDTHHPKLDDYDDYLFFIMHAARWSAEEEELQTIELDCFLSSQTLVTHHLEALPSIQEAKVRCLKKEGALSQGTDYLLHVILDTLVDNYGPLLEQIREIIETVEEEVFSNPTPQTLNHLFALKKEVAHLWHLGVHQKEILSRLTREKFSVIRQNQTAFYRDVYDHLVLVCDLTESYRDLISSAMNVYISVMSSRTNEVMKILTIFAVILLPLSVIASIYGMNFHFMPELEWHYGYYAVLGAMAFFALGMLVFFRWKKWL
jgi:magnesium transporter